MPVAPTGTIINKKNKPTGRVFNLNTGTVTGQNKSPGSPITTITPPTIKGILDKVGNIVKNPAQQLINNPLQRPPSVQPIENQGVINTVDDQGNPTQATFSLVNGQYQQVLPNGTNIPVNDPNILNQLGQQVTQPVITPQNLQQTGLSSMGGLNFGQPQAPIQVPETAPQATPQAPQAGINQENIAQAGLGSSAGMITPQVPQVNIAPVVPETVQEAPVTPEVQKPRITPPEQVFEGVLSQTGTNPQAFAEQFSANPQQSIQNLVSEIMKVTNLPELKTRMSSVINQIEELENERDEKLVELDDNPWLSQGTRNRRKQALIDSYENKIANRTNKLKLFETIADDARQEAQFVANLAINQFNAQNNFAQGQLEFAINQAEKQADNERLLQQQEFKQSLDIAELDLAERKYGLDVQKLGLARAKEEREATMTGTTGISPVTGKPFTENQAKAGTFANRIEQAESVLSGGKGLFVPFSPEFARTADRRRFEQATKNFITAVLRRESGAAISDTEFADAERVYIPKFTDDAETLRQKAISRKIIQQGLINESVGAYEQVKEQLPDFGTQEDISDQEALNEAKSFGVFIDESTSGGVLGAINKLLGF